MPDPLLDLENARRDMLGGGRGIDQANIDQDKFNSVEHAPKYEDGGWWDSIRSFASKTIDIGSNLAGMMYGGGYYKEILGEYAPSEVAMKGLGLAGDISRTAIHKLQGGTENTDISAAIMDKSKAATGMDLLQEMGYQKFADEGEKSLLKRLPDIGMEFLADAVTDPTMYIGVGELSRAGKMSRSIGLEAMAALGKGDLLGAEGQMAKMGKSLRDIQGWKSAVGLEETLAGRLKSGQQNLLQVHIPLASLFGFEGHVAVPFMDKALAPVIEHVANGYIGADKLAQAVAPLRSISRAAETAKDFFFNPEFAHAGGGMQRLAEAVGNNEARKVVEDLHAMRGRLSAAGLKESEYAKPMHIKIVSMGKEGKEMRALSEAADVKINTLPEPKRNALMKEVNEYHTITERMLKTLRANGVSVDDLGSSIARDMAVAHKSFQELEAEFGDQLSKEQARAGANIKAGHEALLSQTDKNLEKRLESYLDLHSVPEAVVEGLKNIDSRFASPIFLRQNITRPENRAFLEGLGYTGFKNLQTRNSLEIVSHTVTPREGTGAVDGELYLKNKDGKVVQVQYIKVGDKANIDWMGAPTNELTPQGAPMSIPGIGGESTRLEGTARGFDNAGNPMYHFPDGTSEARVVNPYHSLPQAGHKEPLMHEQFGSTLGFDKKPLSVTPGSAIKSAPGVDVGDLGSRGSMDVLRLLQEEYPELKEITGERISGARAKADLESLDGSVNRMAKFEPKKVLRHKFNTLSDLAGNKQEFGSLWTQEHAKTRATPSSLLDSLRASYEKLDELKRGIQNPASVQESVPEKVIDAMADVVEREKPGIPRAQARIEAINRVSGQFRNKLADMQHEVAKAENDYIGLKNLYDNTPNWIPMTVTTDALHAFVKDGGYAAELLRPDVRIALERNLKINGRPADAPTFNKIVQNLGTDVTAHNPVAKGLSITEAIKAFRTGGKDEVLKASKELGEFFEINPIVALESRVNKMASAISKSKQTASVAEFWGIDVPKAGFVDLGRFDAKYNGKYVPQDVFEGLVGSWKVAQFQMPEIFNATKIPYLTRFWKSFNTGAVPVFHMRNKIGNIIRRLQEGAISFTPEGMHNDWTIQKGQFMAHNGASMEELNKLRIKLGNHGEVGFGEFLNQAREYNVPGMGEYAMDITDDLAARADFLTRVMRGELPASKQLSEVTGQLIGAKASKGFSLTSVGKFIEDSDRLASFAEFLRKGETHGGAAMLVDKTLFNYQHISPAVEIARKTGLFPFAAWSAKNIPAQVEAFLTRPGQFAAMLHARDAIENGVPGLKREALGNYLKSKFNVVTGQDEHGNWVIHDMSGVIPLADLPDIIGPDAMRAFFAKSMGPLPRLLAHRLFNKNTFTLKDVEKFDGQMGLYQTPVGPIPIDVDTGYDIATLMPRFPGSLTRFDQSPKSAANWQGSTNILNPVPSYTANPKEMLKSDIQYYKNQMSMAKADVNKWQRAGNRIMYDVAMKAYLKKKDDLQKYLAASASRKDAP